MNGWNPKANEIFAQAIEIESSLERAAFVEQVCNQDAALRDRVQHMLSLHENAGSFLMSPPFELCAEPMSDDPVLPIGTRIGRYRIDSEIARGGMGTVLWGQDLDLGRDLAIKVLLPSFKNVPAVEQRFIEEAQIGGQLQHPGIAPVYELGRLEDGRPFFSMKLVKGQTLASALRGRKTPDEDCNRFLGVFEQICQTVAYAHSRGVIHRDLKPANVMLGAFGEVQVMDWGLAKVLDREEAAGEKSTLDNPNPRTVIRTVRSSESTVPGSGKSHTLAGSVMGTPAYMSPEQACGDIHQVDERADVFGLGAILCEILTGSPPYVGESGDDVFRSALQGDLEPCFSRLQATDAETDLQQLVRDCLSVSLVNRLRNAGEVASRISHYLESVQTRLREAELQMATETARTLEAFRTAASERKRRQATMALAATVFLSATLGGGVFVWLKQREQSRMQTNTHFIETTLDKVYQLRALAESARPEERLNKWDAALAQANKAKEFLTKGEVSLAVAQRTERVLADVQSHAERAQRESQLAAKEHALLSLLSDIRLRRAESFDGTVSFDSASTDKRYEEAFSTAELDLLGVAPSIAAMRIKNSPSRDELIIAIDLWVRSIPVHLKKRNQLIEIANLVDDDDWRRKLRSAATNADVSALRFLAQNLDAQPPAMIVAIGVALRDCDATDTSVDILQSAQLRDPDDFWINLELGRSLSKAGKDSQAVGFSRAAVSIRPASAGALWDLAVHLRNNGEIDQSINIFRRLRELAPEDLYVRTACAQLLVLQGRIEEAIEQCQQAIRINPTHSWGYRGLGNAFQLAGRKSDAIAAFRQAVAVAPDDSEAHRALNSLLKEEGQQTEAMKVTGDLLELASLHEIQDKMSDAIHVYQQAIETDPRNAMAQYRLGAILEHEGKLDLAVVAFESAVAFDPQFAKALESLRDAQVMVRIAPKLDQLPSGDLELSDEERLAAARIAFGKKEYAQSARLCRELAKQQLDLTDRQAVMCRCVGAQAATRASLLTTTADDNDQPILHRREAVSWLSEVLNFYTPTPSSANSALAPAILETIQSWRTNPDLAAIRDYQFIERLPVEERAVLTQFWEQVNLVLVPARSSYFQALFADQPKSEALASSFADALLEEHPCNWSLLEVDEMRSEAGAILTKLPDKSILASGTNANGEVYRLRLRSSLQAIAAVRLEALPHESLPLGGPGRAEDTTQLTGDFVLTCKVQAIPLDDDEPATSLEFSDAWSDQSHRTYPIQASGYWNFGAWSPGMGQGRPHEAIFELRAPHECPVPTDLLVELRFQADPPFHTNLGRFRLSVSSTSPHLAQYRCRDGFEKLAIAYRAVGDTASLDQLLKRMPRLSSGNESR